MASKSNVASTKSNVASIMLPVASTLLLVWTGLYSSLQWRIQRVPVRHGIPLHSQKNLNLISDFMNGVCLFNSENQQKMLQKYSIYSQ